MKQGLFQITENIPLTDSVMRMRLLGDVSDITCPGQFINIQLDGLYLRRPISVYDRDDSSVTIIYKVVGKGTEQMRNMQIGETLDVLTGLGNGYDLSLSGEHPLLLGGGVGVPPLYMLAKELIAEGKTVSVILGFNTKNEVFGEEEFRALGADVTVISRSGPDDYDHLDRHADTQIIANTTPVGMYPHNGAAAVDLRRFPRCEGVLDIVYNPARTALLLQAEELGIPHAGGLSMLVAQA